MTLLTCPICGADVDEDKHRVAELLENKGYFHLDIWLKCPECKYTPAFGKELSDAKPIYWRPGNLPPEYKKQVEAALRKHTPPLHCPWCGAECELHKVWIHTWSQHVNPVQGAPVRSDAVVDVRNAFQFVVQNTEGKVGKYFIPAGIMSQWKCKNWKCKYVRYVTL